MAEIIYFGTNGCSGHYPIGIDKTLTGAEYEIWRECDNETWINNIRKNPGLHLIKHHVSSDGKEYDEGWDGDNYHLVKKILKELEV